MSMTHSHSDQLMKVQWFNDNRVISHTQFLWSHQREHFTYCYAIISIINK
uniref:Uncharacterized protein n=1 Tax=Arundo donax TaxID=35708 RepID=A0A0A8ZM24_ARUDO